MAFEAYLRKNGYREKAIECVCPHCVTASEFALTHPKGKYILMCQDGAILVSDGCCVDFRGIGDEIILYYYEEADDVSD